jgi:very-short-patch-repair endonuclease
MPLVNPKLVKSCYVCGKHLSNLRTFCSERCRSQRHRYLVEYSCHGCGITFRKWPCMKRKTNYCTVECYWNSSRTEERRKCKVCGKDFIATGAQIRHGFGIFCSRSCQHKTYPKKVKKKCKQCGKFYYLQPSKDRNSLFCGKVCHDDYMRDYVVCVCRYCKKEFEIPRSDLNRGRGTYCSRRCFVSFGGSSFLELKMEKALIMSKLEFEREVKFKRFHVDFLLKKHKTAIECDGEYWHLLPKAVDRDRRKDILLQSLGYKVLRFTGNELDKLNETKLSKVLLQRFSSN